MRLQQNNSKRTVSITKKDAPDRISNGGPQEVHYSAKCNLVGLRSIPIRGHLFFLGIS